MVKNMTANCQYFIVKSSFFSVCICVNHANKSTLVPFMPVYEVPCKIIAVPQMTLETSHPHVLCFIFISVSIQLKWPKNDHPGRMKEQARFVHDRFGLIADSVDCDEIHLKEVSFIDVKHMIVEDMKTLNQTVCLEALTASE